jgi:hypothetical protein
VGLSLLFDNDDKIFLANVDYAGTCDEFVGNVYSATAELLKKPRNFFCINPVKGQRRLKSEVKAYRNFLFESDNNPIEQQFSMLPKLAQLGIIRTATFSGSKSIHYVVSCADDLNLGEAGSDAAEARYKAIWLGLAQIFESQGLSIDKSNKNPAVLSRIPGAFRDDAEQRLLHTGNLVDAAFLQSVAVELKERPRLIAAECVASYEELERRLAKPQHSRLNMYIKYPAWINESNGNYPMLYRLTLWAADEVGATPETFAPYLEKHLLPHLKAKNYFKDWYLPVEHAFRSKGML